MKKAAKKVEEYKYTWEDLWLIAQISGILGLGLATIHEELVVWQLHDDYDIMVDLTKKEMGFCFNWNWLPDDKTYFALRGIASNFGYTTAEYNK
jgi:hypothetical protein